MTNQPDDELDLTAAERTLRKLADDARTDRAAGQRSDDLFECYRLVVDELDRVRGRLHDLEGEGPHLADPVDEKGRGPSYWRGHADGRLAERAGTGYEVEEQYGLCVGDPDRGVMRTTDQPPFAPELADAPLVTGESGAPAPLVVDHPVHDSTLPAELEQDDGR